ncbi:MAG: SH3 domain-containing protein [Eggerthellaceae bacterium]|jgi:uncharacterized protein YxeA
MDRRMGNRWLLVAALCAACAVGLFACLMVTAQPAQAATAKNATIIGVHSKMSTSFAYTKTVKAYDITGDKKADKLTIKKSRKNSSSVTSLCIYVNGKKVKTLSIYFPPGSAPEVQVKYLRTSSKKPFLYISLIGVDLNGIYGVYRYKSDKLVKLVKPTSAIAQKYGDSMILDSAKASGKKVSVRFLSITKTLGAIGYAYDYAYKSGKLVRTSATASKFASVEGVSLKNQPLAYNTKIYKAAGSSNVAYTAKAGTKLTISKMVTLKGQPWFYVKNAKGQTGWIKGISKYTFELFGTYKYSTLFKNLYL